MTTIHVRLDADKLTLRDMEVFEGDKSKRWSWMVDILARMAQDEYGVPLPYEDAVEEIRKIPVTDASRYVDQLLESVAVPKVTATAS